MNVPDILGVEVLTPDGRGSILSLYNRKVIVHINKVEPNQVMKGDRREEMHYAYDYKDVRIIKGQYCFDDKRINLQYESVPSEIENNNVYKQYDLLTSKGQFNTNNLDIKDECEKAYEQINSAKAKLAEIRKTCCHERKEQKPYSWRVGAVDIVWVCNYCGENLDYLTSQT